MNIKIFLALSVAFLFACGGGSSGTTSAAASNPAAAASGTNDGNITDQLQIVE